MKIDKDVEIAVREALAAAVGGEPERFEAAVEGIARRGDGFANQAFGLVFAIDSTAFFSVQEGQRPDDEHLHSLAGEYIETEDWSGIDENTVFDYLHAIADMKPPFEVMSSEDVIFTCFAVGGWLLAAFLPPGGKINWNDFLDVILAKIEETDA